MRMMRLAVLITGLSVFGSVAAISLPGPLPAGKPVAVTRVRLLEAPAFHGLGIAIVPSSAALVMPGKG